MPSPLLSPLRNATLFFFVVWLTACSSISSNRIGKVNEPEPGHNDMEQVRRYADEVLQAAAAMSPDSAFSAVLVNEDGVLWQGSTGQMGTADPFNVTADTPLQIGSITKLFTALSIMQLVEKGELDLDAPLTQYIPEFSIQSRFNSEPFSIRQMLSHYSGLPSDLVSDWFTEPDHARSVFNATVEKSALSHLKSEPNYAFSYSNLAYQLLGKVIERVSGESYDSYLKTHIFTPLNMHDTVVLVADEESRWPELNGSRNPLESGYSIISSLPAGAIASSASDMSRFMQMLLAKGEGIVNEATFETMLTVQGKDAVFTDTTYQGLGFSLSTPFTTYNSFGHNGSVPPYYALTRIYPDEGLGVTVMQRTGDEINRISQLGYSILNAAAEADGPPPEPSRDSALSTPSLTKKRFAHAEQATEYEGYYFGTNLGLIEVTATRKGLTLRPTQIPMVKMKFDNAGNSRFLPRIKALGFLPIPASMLGPVGSLQGESRIIDGKRHLILHAERATELHLGVKFDPVPLSGIWLQRLGRYAPTNTEHSMIREFTLYIDTKTELLHLRALPFAGSAREFPVEFLSDNQATIPGTGRYAGEVAEFISENEILYGAERFLRVDNDRD